MEQTVWATADVPIAHPRLVRLLGTDSPLRFLGDEHPDGAVPIPMAMTVGAAEVDDRLEVRMASRTVTTAPMRVLSYVLECHPTHHPHLFPDLRLELDVFPMGAATAAVTVTAHYHPPGGAVGAMADLAIMRHAFRGFLDRLLDEVVRSWSDALAASPLRPPS